MVSKSLIFLLKSFMGNIYRYLAIFYWSHCLYVSLLNSYKVGTGRWLDICCCSLGQFYLISPSWLLPKSAVPLPLFLFVLCLDGEWEVAILPCTITSTWALTWRGPPALPTNQLTYLRRYRMVLQCIHYTVSLVSMDLTTWRQRSKGNKSIRFPSSSSCRCEHKRKPSC